MSPLYRVALLGFNTFERNTLSSYFRLANNREPRYELVQILTDADFMIADANHAPSVQLVLATERLDDSVFVGTRAPAGARAWLARPVDPLHVLRELDAMVAAQRSPQPPPSPETGGSRVRTVIQPRRRPRAEPAAPPAPPTPPTPAAPPTPPTPAAASAASSAPAALAAPVAPEYPPLELQLPEPAPPPPPPAPAVPPPPRPAPSPPAPLPKTPPLPSALLVDDSEIALRFLQRRLEPFGLVIAGARNSGEALALLARRGFDFVFLDMELGAGSELDGLGLCQRVKREHATRIPPTTVVMVTAHTGELDRVRGALAGCDAFLAKPLDAGELERLLRRHGLRKPEAAPARPGAAG